MMAPRGHTIVIAATPTSNGDLHIGHMAGPYLASDIYARYLRAAGRDVLYSTCTDDSQSYVLTTAHRRGLPPAALCATSTTAIAATLTAMGISMPGLPPIDQRYRDAVCDFVLALHRSGRLRPRTVRLPYAEKTGTYLFDALVSGTCPSCLADSSGGACESCGHPNNFDELLDPKYTLDPTEPVDYREQTILVLPMEDYRERLTAYYAAREATWRPHARQLIRELLAKPLPDAPVTMPGSWGIPAPFPETPGQILYPWVEAMPASMYSTWWAAAAPGQPPATAVDEYWRAGHAEELVYFHGFDNVYHWGLQDLVLLMAHGDRYVLPTGNVCNEFYDLDGEKFSTSRNHLIWSIDLLAKVPRDLVRFYLALTAPEFQRTDFSRERLERVTTRSLVEPWNALADALDAAVGRAKQLATTPAGWRQASVMLARLRSGYQLEMFSLTRTAQTITDQLGRLLAFARRAADSDSLGDLVLQVRMLLAGAAPILIDAAELAAAAGVDLSLTVPPSPTVTPFRLPRLPSLAGSADPKGAR